MKSTHEPIATWTSERTLRLFWETPGPDFAQRATLWCQSLRASLSPFLLDTVPGIRTLTLTTDPLTADRSSLESEARRIVSEPLELGALPVRLVEIPVCFDAGFAPDLDRFPAGTIDRVLEIEFSVALLGFAPGFAYLDGLPPELHTPRRARPRARVEAGSLAIGGRHAAIYPSPSPGGWNLIGRTPLVMFDHTREEPATLRAGDRVRLVRIDLDTFESSRERVRG